MIKKFNEFNKVDENIELAQPKVKPSTPVIKPGTKPSRPSPYRKDRPSVVPRPKATAEDLADKFLNITKNDKDVKSLLKEKYLKKESINENTTNLFEKLSEDKFETDEDGKVTLNVTISNLDSSTAEDFLKMFKFMQWCGMVGAGRSFKAYFDGDGHFRPNIKVKGIDLNKDVNFSDNDNEWEGDELDLDFGA